MLCPLCAYNVVGSHDQVQETVQAGNFIVVSTVYFVICIVSEGIKKKSKRECLQDKAMCSPFGEEYLAWKRNIIELAEAATNGHKSKKQRTR